MLPRTPAAVVAAAAILAAGSSVAVASPSAVARDLKWTAVRALPALDSALVARINVVRAEHGLSRLRVSTRLRTAAASHSYDMLRRGYFAHESVDGTSPWERIKRYYGARGYSRWQIGEALLWYSPDVGAAAAVDDWLSDAEHRQILLDPGFREIGASALHATSAHGTFGGSTITLITADFGARSR